MYVCLYGCTRVYRYLERPECWILLGQKLERVVSCSASILRNWIWVLWKCRRHLTTKISLHSCLSVCTRAHVCLLANSRGGEC